LVHNYVETSIEIFRSYDLARDAATTFCRPENPYTHDFLKLKEMIGREMQQRTIRAFHYRRLTDGEVASLKRGGIHLSTPATLRRRLDEMVAVGGLAREAAARLYAESPFHKQLESRSGKFWMVSHPTAVDDGGAKPLLKH
jgi:hypothetical protein